MSQGALVTAVISLCMFLLGFIIAEIRDLKKTLIDIQVSLSRIETKMANSEMRFEEIKGGLDERISANTRRSGRG